VLGTIRGPAIKHANGIDAQRARAHEKELRQKLEDDVGLIQKRLGSRYVVTLASPRTGNCIEVALKGKAGQGNQSVAKYCPDWDKERFSISWYGTPSDDVEADVIRAAAKVKP
jgi:hypothetical protein